MTCYAELIRPKDNKVLKTDYITKDTYSLCESEVLKRNNKSYKDERYWKIITINV